MPLTPLHFGVGLLGKGLAPASLSITAFMASQVVIDCESGYFLFIAHEWPVHRALHTFALATPLGLVVGAAVWAVVRRTGLGDTWPPLRQDCGLKQSLLGGLLGGVTHPFLDGIMHKDIRPLLPFSSANPFLGIVTRGQLHLLCVLSGIAGLALLTLRDIANRNGPLRRGENGL
jgi:hypothetical protein